MLTLCIFNSLNKRSPQKVKDVRQMTFKSTLNLSWRDGDGSVHNLCVWKHEGGSSNQSYVYTRVGMVACL